MERPRTLGGTCFEVTRTPPDIKRKRQKEEVIKRDEEIAKLTLTPFGEQPVLLFENVRLGHSAVRKLAIQNPNCKPIKVTLEKLPNQEKGFEFEFIEFTLGPEEEAIIQIGWVPTNATPLRETILAKFGKFHAQIRLVATSKAPIEKKKTSISRPPLRTTNPRVNQKRVGNSNIHVKKVETMSPFTIPSNPVTQQPKGTKPPTTYFGKENSKPERNVDTHILHVENETKEHLSTVDVERQSVKNIATPNKEIIDGGFPGIYSTNALLSPERRQTYVKNGIRPLKENNKHNIQKAYLELHPSDIGPLTPERRMTYVKNSLPPVKSFHSNDTNSMPRIPPMKMYKETDSFKKSPRRSLLPESNENSQESNSKYEIKESEKLMKKGSNIQRNMETEAINECQKSVNVSLDLPECVLSLSPTLSIERPLKNRASASSSSGNETNTKFYSCMNIPDSNIKMGHTDVNLSLDIEASCLALSLEHSKVSSTSVPSADDEKLCNEHSDEEALLVYKSEDDLSQHSFQTNYKNDSPVDSEPDINMSGMHLSLDIDAECLVLSPEYSKMRNDPNSISLENEKVSKEESNENSLASNNSEDSIIQQIGRQPICNDLLPVDTEIDDSVSSMHTSLDIAVDGLALSPENSKVSLHVENQQNSKNDSLPFDAEPDCKDSSKDTYVVDEPTPASLDDITEEGSITEEETKSMKEGSPMGETVMQANQIIRKNSFLKDTVIEENFVPPNSDNSKYCSTARKKDKSHDECQIYATVCIEQEKSKVKLQEDTIVIQKYSNLEESVMESNQGVRKDSFLMDTVMEDDFIPPNPDNIKYCSTALKKERTRGDSQEFSISTAVQEKEKSTEIARELFGNDKKGAEITVLMSNNKAIDSTLKLNQKENVSETWIIPSNTNRSIIKHEKCESVTNDSENTLSNQILIKNERKLYKPPITMRNRVSLVPSGSRSSSNKTTNISKLISNSKPVNTRLTLIKPLKSRNVIHHPNPHAANNMYYDERWIEKQENGFKKWLNFVLTPPEGFDDAGSQSEILRNGKLDVAKLWSACTKDVKVPRAPTREVLSLRAYTVQRELNRLRRNACTLLQSPDVANILQKLEIEIEKYRFDMRKDKAIHKDVGMKKKFLQLILNYNPLWLRIGLETVFGRIIPMNGAADYVSLSKFIIRDFLYNPDVLAQFAHPTVPHHYADGHDIKLKQFILKKFFNLILFLDQAKKFRLIKHNPCLFCKDSPIKMSKDIITSFSRDFLSGEGDVMKHLGYLGYKVYHKQTHLDEFDFAVTNIAVDLRCGIRLCRVMEILTKNQGITDNLRMPAQTRMQKLHNVGIGLKALESSSAGPLPEKTTSKDMVDGHLQKTLDVLWHLIFGFQIGQLLNPDRLSKEIQYLEKTLNHEVRVGNEKAKVGWNFYLDSKRRQLKESANKNDNLGWLQNEKIALLLKWARVVCAHYGVEIENLSVSFSDGRGLCLLVHHYHPSFLPLKEICMETTQTQEGNSNVANNGEGSFNDSFGMTMTYSYAKTSDYAGAFEKLLKNEKENFKLLHNKTKELGGIPILIKSDEMSNTIPDQKVTATFMTYMAARLLDLSTEMQAARIIQFAWKRFLAARREQELKVCNKAAVRIQKCFRRFLIRQKVRRFEKAAIIIQSAVRGFFARIAVKNFRLQVKYEKEVKSVILLQTYWRRQLKKLELKKSHEKAAVSLQKSWKCHVERKKFVNQKKAAKKIQSYWKAKVCYRDYQVKKTAIILIQKWVRGFMARKLIERLHSSAIVIQRTWKTYVNMQYHKKIKAIITVQSCVRMYISKKKYLDYQSKNRAAICIQKNWRKIKAIQMKEHQLQAITIIQAHLKGFIARKQIQNQLREKAAICIQKNWRTMKAVQLKKGQLLAISIIQAHVKGFISRKRFDSRKQSAIILQTWWRKTKSENEYHRKKQACSTVQRYVRGYLVKIAYRKVRAAAVILQKHFKRHKEEKEKQKKMIAIITLQKHFRRFLEMKKKTRKLHAVLLLQTHWRRCSAQKNFKKFQWAAITLQKNWKVHRTQTIKRLQLHSIVVLQSHWKSYLQRREFMNKRNSAIIIQKFWRSRSASRKYQLLLNCTIIVQKNWRGYVARKFYQNLRQSSIAIQNYWRRHRAIQEKKYKMNAIITIQKCYRGYVEEKKYRLLQWATVTLQKNWRCQREQRIKYKKLTSIILLQSHVKSFLEKKKFQKKKNAAIKIQSFYRRKVAVNRLQKAIKNVTIIQKIWRSKSEQKKFQQLKLSSVTIQKYWRRHRAIQVKKYKMNAIITIQTCYRRYTEQTRYRLLQWATVTLQTNWRRRRAQIIKNKKLASIILLQSHVKSFLERKEFQKKKNAAIKIQALYRRRIVFNQLQKATKNAIIIQKFWRSKSEQKKFQQLKRSTVTIQKYWRRFFDKKMYRNLLCAAIILQKHWRKILAMRKKKERIEKVIILQSFSRMVIQRQRYLKLKKSAILVQAQWKRKQTEKEYRKVLISVVLVQALWRGCTVRKNIEKQHLAATIIQKHWKAYLARLSVARIRAAVKIQSFARMMVQRKKYCQYNKRLKAAVVIQKNFRRTMAMKMKMQQLQSVLTIQSFARALVIRRNFLTLKKGVTTIQACWRAKIEIRRYGQKKKSAIIIQKYARTYLARKMYKNDIHSIVLVQSFWRRHEAVKMKKKYLHAAKMIQHFSKLTIQRTRFLRLKSATILVQANWRMKLAHQKYQKIQISACIIQKHYRRHQVQKIYQHKKAAVVVFQKCWRGNVGRKKALDMKEKLAIRHANMTAAAKIIQNQWKNYQIKKSRTRLIAKLTKVQAYIRGYIQRQKYLKSKTELKRLKDERHALLEHNSAVQIQHFMKGYTVRSKYKRTIHSATAIQAYWRGYKQRQVRERWWKRIQEVREKVQQANKNVTEEKKLYHRTLLALDYLYTTKDMSHLIKVIKDLEFATRYSPSCCVKLIENNGKPLLILADLLERCNRSLPHMEVVSTICDIFISISELVETRSFFANWDKCTKILEITFHLMNHFKENKKPLYIFSKCCAFLWKLCHHSNVSKILNKKEQFDKLAAYETAGKNRKNSLVSTRSGTSLQSYSTFRGRSNTDPTSGNKKTKPFQKKLSLKHGGAELSPNIVRFYEDYQLAITSLNRQIRRGNTISE